MLAIIIECNRLSSGEEEGERILAEKTNFPRSWGHDIKDLIYCAKELKF